MSNNKQLTKTRAVAGSVELLYRRQEAEPPEPGEPIDLNDYELACRPFGLAEFDDPFAVMEWCHANPPVVRSIQQRPLQRFDLINMIISKGGNGMTFMIGDLDNDRDHMYDGCRVQHDACSLCPYVMIPLRGFTGSICNKT